MDEKKDKFGGILIRSIVELDDHLKPIGKLIVGPIKSMDVLFKKIDAFDREKSRVQVAVIVEEGDGRLRWVDGPVRDGEEAADKSWFAGK